LNIKSSGFATGYSYTLHDRPRIEAGNFDLTNTRIHKDFKTIFQKILQTKMKLIIFKAIQYARSLDS
jgi:hypothetical protein